MPLSIRVTTHKASKVVINKAATINEAEDMDNSKAQEEVLSKLDAMMAMASKIKDSMEAQDNMAMCRLMEKVSGRTCGLVPL